MEQRTALTLREAGMQISPAEVVETATTQAKLLMNIVEQTKCYQEISGKKYLQVEAWETIGAFNRTHTETETITPIIKDNETIGYQAHVQLWRDGIIVGGAIMPCYFTENCCKGKEGDAKHKACISAAQTFATSKAYRMNYSYVAILAGFQPLPAEEITEDMTKPVDKSQHWCKVHDTTFFKKGKMISYAHPIEGTDPKEWCHEPSKTKRNQAEAEETEEPGPEEAPQTTALAKPIPSQPEPAKEKKGFIDMDWLKESQKILKWTDKTMATWLVSKYKVKGGLLEEVIAQLTKEQQKEFVQEIQDRREMS